MKEGGETLERGPKGPRERVSEESPQSWSSLRSQLEAWPREQGMEAQPGQCMQLACFGT